MTNSSTSILIYHPIVKAKKGEPKIKGQMPYFTIRGGNENIVLLKEEAIFCKRFLELASAEEKIGEVLFKSNTKHWIKEEAAECGLTLVGVIEAAVNYTVKRPRSTSPVEGPERLASILAKLAPNESPKELGERLKELVDASLPEAIEHLKVCEKNGRRDGYIYLRKQGEKGQVA